MLEVIKKSSNLKSIEKIENEISNDKISLAILLELGKHERMTYLELRKKIYVNEKILQDKLTKLEREAFVRQNPNKTDEKPFEERIYILDLRGILFLNKLRYIYSEHLKSIKFFF